MESIRDSKVVEAIKKSDNRFGLSPKLLDNFVNIGGFQNEQQYTNKP